MRLGWNRSQHETTMIYIVYTVIDYEGTITEGVFLDKDKAIARARQVINDHYSGDGVIIEEWEDGGLNPNGNVYYEE